MALGFLLRAILAFVAWKVACGNEVMRGRARVNLALGSAVMAFIDINKAILTDVFGSNLGLIMKTKPIMEGSPLIDDLYLLASRANRIIKA